jgi:hypothetical protein
MFKQCRPIRCLSAVAVASVVAVGSLFVASGPVQADPPDRQVNSFSFGEGSFACDNGLVFFRFTAQKSAGPVSGGGDVRSGTSGATILTFELTSGQIRDDSYVLNGKATSYACDPTVSPDRVRLQIKGTCNTGDPQLGIIQHYRDTAGNSAFLGAGISFADCFVT